MSTYENLLSHARQQYSVAYATTVPDIVKIIEAFGPVPLDFERYREDLVDEFVDGSLVAAAFTLYDPLLLRQRASREEVENYFVDPTEEFDPLEFGEANREWTLYSRQVEGMDRVHIVIERSANSENEVANFRVYGEGQWLRESLWAATGVVPRDVGAPTGHPTFFGSAFQFFDREPFTSLPLK